MRIWQEMPQHAPCGAALPTDKRSKRFLLPRNDKVALPAFGHSEHATHLTSRFHAMQVGLNLLIVRRDRHRLLKQSNSLLSLIESLQCHCQIVVSQCIIGVRADAALERSLRIRQAVVLQIPET